MIIAMTVITLIYLLLISVQDLKEKAFYTFPANVLTVLWSVIAVRRIEASDSATVMVCVVFIGLYLLLNFGKIWGEGDSDLFLLNAAIYFAVSGYGFGIESIIVQILMFAGVLLIAMCIGVIEAKIKKEKINRLSSIAVAPGFLFVTGAVLLKGVILC